MILSENREYPQDFQHLFLCLPEREIQGRSRGTCRIEESPPPWLGRGPSHLLESLFDGTGHELSRSIAKYS